MPYLDRSASTCVSDCPEGSLLITNTKECVRSCMDSSFLDQENIYIYRYNNECLERCPEGYIAEVVLHLENEVRCIPRNSLILISDHIKNASLEQRPITECYKNFSKACRIDQRVKGKFDSQFSLKNLTEILFEPDNAVSIREDPDFFWSLFRYFQGKDLKNFNNDQVDSLISNLAFACHNDTDAFYFLSLAEQILSSKENSTNFINATRKMFDSIIHCLNNLQESLVPVNTTIHFEGRLISCNVSKHDHTKIDDIMTYEFKSNRIDINFEISYSSLHAHPFDFIHCLLRHPPPQELLESEFHLIGVTSLYNPSEPWFGRAAFKLIFDNKNFDVRVWKNESWELYSKEDSVNLAFNTFNDVNSMVFVQIPVDTFSFDHALIPEESEGYLIVSLIGLIFAVILCICCRKLSFRKDEQVKRKIAAPVDEMESIIELKKEVITIRD